MEIDDLNINLEYSDKKLIEYRLRMIPSQQHRQVLENYKRIYLETLEKEQHNVAKYVLARHYANWFIKKYR